MQRRLATKTGAIALSSHTYNQNGFTLIEVLIALMIFTFGLLSIAGLQVSAISYDSAANQRTAITMLTQGIMEEIMSYPEDNSNSGTLDLESSVTDQTWTQAPFDSADNSYTLTGGGTYSASVTVTPDTPVASMSQIEVTVTSTNDRTLTLTSYKRMD
jgi:type IV pilus assembly protein PilV